SITAKYLVNAAGEPIRETTAGSEIAEEYLGEVGDVQSGGSVATSAFDVLRVLGASEIYLLGQDLAYVGKEIHSTGTHHNEKWLTLVNRKTSLEKINVLICKKRKTKIVDSNEGKKVLSDYVLSIYKTWFEESALKINFPVYNVNVKGAKIENIPAITTTQAEEFLSKYREHNYPWKKLPPWIPKKDRTSEDKKISLIEEISLFEKVLNIYENSSLSEVEVFESLQAELQTKPYLNSMIRKTQIYLKRHSDLSSTRKRELLISALKKELKFLKRGLLANQ
ncbi:MAG: hypothetical protein N3A69_13140, partial [Leptospiraceae bacterium]|nr:hypothetical protein [Leptospiraceae bacterium]